MEDIVVRIEQPETTVANAAPQIDAIVELAGKIGTMEESLRHMQESIEKLKQVDVAVITAVAETKADIQEAVVEVATAISELEQGESEMTEEIKEDTKKIEEEKAEEANDGPTAQEEIADAAKEESEAKEGEPERDSSPGKEHWFFRKLR